MRGRELIRHSCAKSPTYQTLLLSTSNFALWTNQNNPFWSIFKLRAINNLQIFYFLFFFFSFATETTVNSRKSALENARERLKGEYTKCFIGQQSLRKEFSNLNFRK